ARLDASLQAMKQAWAGETTANFLTPRCVQRPHPPIWVGGNSPAAIRRAVAHGDGWSPFPATPRTAAAVDTAAISDVPTLAAAIARYRSLAAEGGAERSLDVCFTPFTHPGHKSIVDPGALVAEAQELAGIGVTWLAFHLPAPSVDEFCDTVTMF